MGEQDAPALDETSHPIDSWRHGIAGFLLDYPNLQPQIKCPAKNLWHPTAPDRRPCFQCLDAQVINCVVQQPPRNEQLIRQHRPARGEE